MKEKVIAQGAEAKIILIGDMIIKDRVKKAYRLPELDYKIRKQRTKSERKILEKVSKIISAPNPTETKEKDNTKIIMPYINGKRLSQELDNFSDQKQKEICKNIGKSIAKIHDEGIIHGDLTTSNMIYTEDKVFFIDFGLGFHSIKTEDKAVDLHLLKEALKARHFKSWDKLFQAVEKGYSTSKSSKEILERLKKVESRGRYKEKY